MVNADGCSADQVVPCAAPAAGGTWANHQAYVDAFTAVADGFLTGGFYTQAERDAAVAAATASSCGDTVTPTPTPPGDSDSDGVTDDVDTCPDTPAGEVVDAVGCSVSQLAPCDSDWKNHGEYVSSVVHIAQDFVTAGLLTVEQAAAIVEAAANSECGKGDGSVEPTPTPAGSEDSDSDGVTDGNDVCPGTPAGAIVDEDGCSFEQLALCDGNWKNHGQYVSAVAHVTHDFVVLGLLTEEERTAIVDAAAHSNCGNKN